MRYKNKEIKLMLPVALGMFCLSLMSCGDVSKTSMRRSQYIANHDHIGGRGEVKGDESIAIPNDGPFFLSDVKPILDRYCVSCHSPEAPLGGVVLTYENLIAEDGDLLKRVIAEIGGGDMPPVGALQISEANRPKIVDLLSKWEKQGFLYKDESSDELPPVACKADTIPDSSIKRLSNNQIKYTLYAYFGYPAFYNSMPALFDFVFKLLPDDKALSHLELGNAYQEVSATHVESQLAVARHFGKLMSTIDERWRRVYPSCLKSSSRFDDETRPSDDCVKSFISDWGMRVFKRPLDDSEVNRYLEIFFSYQDTIQGVERLWTEWVFSPYFLYNLFDRSVQDPSDPTKFKLTSYERATQLAYALTGRGPDAELMTKAKDGSLEDPVVYNSEFERLFAMRKEHFFEFTREWLQLDDGAYRPREVYETSSYAQLDDPYYQKYDDVSSLYRTHADILYFSTHGGTPANANNNLILEYSYHIIGNDNFSKYFTMPVNMLDFEWATTKPFRRFAQTLTDGTYEMQDFPNRRGILTHLSTNMQNQNQNHVNPILKGIYIRENFFCEDAGDFPLDIGAAPSNTAIPLRDDTNKHMTTREIVHDLTKTPQCWACHKMWNGIGNAMANYGALGEYRTVERIYKEEGSSVSLLNELPLDTTDTIIIDGKAVVVKGVQDLQHVMANSKTVQKCFTKRLLFQHMLGRKANSSDMCFLESSRARMVAPGGSIKNMLKAAFNSDQTKYKTVRP